MTLFRHKLFLAVTFGHFTIDLFNNAGPVLVAFLSIPMGLTASQIGLAVGMFQFSNAISQPFFGWLADKIGSRWLGPGSVLWTIIGITLSFWVAQTSQNYTLFLLLFTITALGVGAFHPLGTMHAATTSTKQAATGTAIFFLFGQTGLATGPLLVGILLDEIGPLSVYGLALAGIPMVGFMVYAMRHADVAHQPSSQPNKSVSAQTLLAAVQWRVVGLLAVLIALRSWAFIGTVSFLPKLFQEMGWQATGYGAITGAYWMASAMAGVVAGHFADRLGRRQITFITMGIGSLLIYFLPLYNTWFAFVLAMLVGGLIGASHSILVVISQDVLPGSKSLASGITLGYLFGMGAIATWLIGVMADYWGLAFSIQLGAVLGVLSAGLALFLPATRPKPSIIDPIAMRQSP